MTSLSRHALALLTGALASCATQRPPTHAALDPGAPTGPCVPDDPEPTPGTAEDERGAPRADERPAPSPLHGSWWLRYAGRFTDSDQDHDLRGILALDLDDPTTPWIRGHLLARADLDLDGRDEGPVFRGLDDTYDSSLVAHLHAANVDLALGEDPEHAPGTLRIGRQDDPELPEVLRFDGVSFRSRPRGTRAVSLGLYGGVPAHLYESSHEGDRALGTFVEARPWRGARARLDWMHLEDAQRLGEQRDDLLALGLWQHVERFGWLEGRYTRLEGRGRDLDLRALYQPPDTRTVVRLAYFELFGAEARLAQELDPFFDQLQEYFPYRQASLSVAHDLGEHLGLDLGLDARRVRDARDVGEFNRDWNRAYLTASLHDLGTPGLELSVTADRWNDEHRDESALGADLSYSDGSWRVALGSAYALYKYEFLELAEREDVRTTYLRATHAVSSRLRLELGYELEDDDLATYHTLRGGLRWSF